jgi:hypothetical protein
MIPFAVLLALYPPDPVLRAGTQVRITASSIDTGWLTGAVAEPIGGCLVIVVKAKRAPAGRLNVYLRSVERLQVREDSAGRARWTEIPMIRARGQDADCARE